MSSQVPRGQYRMEVKGGLWSVQGGGGGGGKQAPSSS
jgi:hypothetical protein